MIRQIGAAPDLTNRSRIASSNQPVSPARIGVTITNSGLTSWSPAPWLTIRSTPMILAQNHPVQQRNRDRDHDRARAAESASRCPDSVSNVLGLLDGRGFQFSHDHDRKAAGST